ncbi:DUF423 domain-containing protein [Mesorhizobium sp. LHD-90]|uniref:DUF423 domain-containing protein n=1 Tax=Mesorhizobium sp. LHD-90 TaxID=3071414 RepID=UPI0027E0FA18|nr:DUF423 domain-containing protein [Mesorhizobium sp. LHD-90]MDQ6432790.1 DUF423 domain-containing protein [Mesorhizobium sp. LHD-90]
MAKMAERVLVVIAGLAGAAGVALSAAAAHGSGQNLQTAANLLLIHAPALLATALLAGRAARLGGAVLALGLVLFCGDLLARDFLGGRLFPYAAPAGGLLLIAGWLVIAASAPRRQ